MNLLDLFKITRRPVPPPKSRLALALEETERLKDLLKEADKELHAAAEEAFPQGKLIYAEYKGYGIIIGTQIDWLYNADIHTMTYLQPPRIEAAQIHKVKIGNIRIVKWEEVAKHSGYLQWINDHPLSSIIYQANKQ